MLTAFVQCKDFKSKPYKHRYYRRILLDEITAKNKALRDLKKETFDCEKALLNNTTWLKRKCIYYSINNIVNRKGKRLTLSLNNKFNKIVEADQIAKGIHPNPNI